MQYIDHPFFELGAMMYTLSDGTKLSNDQLGELYSRVVGYNPFEDAKGTFITEEETRATAIESLMWHEQLPQTEREFKKLFSK